MNIKLVKDIIKKWSENSEKHLDEADNDHERDVEKYTIYQPLSWKQGYYKGLMEAYEDCLKLIKEEEKEMKIDVIKFEEIAEERGLDIVDGLNTFIVQSKEDSRWSCFIDLKTKEFQLNFLQEDVTENDERTIDECLPKDLENFYTHLVLKSLTDRVRGVDF
jgi:hypothetical protein